MRFSDLELGKRLLIDERENLWPIAPALVERCDTWLARADELLLRRDEHAELGVHIARRRGARGSFANESEVILDEILETLLAQPDELVTARIRVLDRHGHSSSSRARTLEAFRAEWAQCCTAIASSPHYGGLALEPLAGLVPLGENPAGLWEFWVIESGTQPRWDPARGGVLEESSGLVLVLIPGGPFTLGSIDEDFGAQDNEWPLKDIELATYLISKYELTQAQWAAYDDARRPATYGSGHSLHAAGIRADLCPVESVDWFEAAALLARLGLEFPTEAQWEHACRAGSIGAYSFGEDWQAAASAYGNFRAAECNGVVNDGDDHLFQWADDFRVTAPVGSFAPNAFGLYDMHGNVHEWCREPYGQYLEAEPRPRDGYLEHSFNSDAHTVRGGSFLRSSIYARSAQRVPVQASSKENDLGLRPVRTL